MKYLVFMRRSGMHRPLGAIGEMPFDNLDNWAINNPDPFIIVRVEESTLANNMQLLGERGLRLKLDKLRSEYPDTSDKYVDENGVEQERTNYGYFSENGRSTLTDHPVITIEDVEVVNG